MTRTAAPAHDLLNVLIVGSGLSGLCLALQLQPAGRRWHLPEQASALGGTWRDKHYPGAAWDETAGCWCVTLADGSVRRARTLALAGRRVGVIGTGGKRDPDRAGDRAAVRRAHALPAHAGVDHPAP